MTRAKHQSATPRRASQGQPNPVDVWFGARIRERRVLLGLSQETLAAPLGITFQQLQKYERGANRVSVSRLVDIAAALGCSPAELLDGIPADIAAQSPAKLGTAPAPEPGETDPMLRRRTVEIARLIGSLPPERAADVYAGLRLLCRGAVDAAAAQEAAA